MCLGAGLWLTSDADTNTGRRICGSVVVTIATLTLAEHLFDVSFGIDQMLLARSGRMAWVTACNFLLLGLAGLLADLPSAPALSSGLCGRSGRCCVSRALAPTPSCLGAGWLRTSYGRAPTAGLSRFTPCTGLRFVRISPPCVLLRIPPWSTSLLRAHDRDRDTRREPRKGVIAEQAELVVARNRGHRCGPQR